MPEQDQEVDRREWWRGWEIGVGTGLVAAGAGFGIAVWAMSPHLSNEPDVVTIPGIAVGGALVAGFTSMAMAIAALAEHRQRRKN